MKIQDRNCLFCALTSLALLCAITVVSSAQGKDKGKPPDSTPAYRNPALTVDERVADLMSRMTLEEKIGQIAPSGNPKTEVIDPTGTYTSDTASAVLNRWWDPDLEFTPRKAAILRNGVQRYIKEKTRLGIPELIMGEALHGFMEYGSTSFPQALGLASTFDPELVHQVFSAAGEEAGSAGRWTGFLAGARHCPRPALGTHGGNVR